MDKVQISAWQFYLMTFIFVLGTSFFYVPKEIIQAAGPDSWMLPLGASLIGLLISFIWLRLADFYPGLSLIEICMEAAGKKAGWLFAFMFIWFFMHSTSFVVRNLGDFMKTTLMQRTPITAFHVLILIVACYAVIKGVEAIGRTTEILAIFIVFAFLIIFIFMILDWSWERYLGAFQSDIWKAAWETRFMFGFPYMEPIAFLMLFPLVKNNRKKSFILGILTATIMLSLIMFFIVGALGVSRSSHTIYPIFVIIQEMELGTFFQNMEAMLTLILLASIFIKLAIMYYCTVTGFCHLFKIKDRTWIALPFILIISGMALEFDNVLENMEFNQKHSLLYSSFHSVLLPLLLLFLAWLRRLLKRRASP